MGRLAIAVIVAAVFATVGIGMLRSLGARRPSRIPAVPTVPPPDVRIVFWCQTCGTELLVIRTGTDLPPRHCGEPMTRRDEVTRN